MGSLVKYQEDLNKDPSFIALFIEILIDLLPNNTAMDITEGAIPKSCLNSL